LAVALWPSIAGLTNGHWAVCHSVNADAQTTIANLWHTRAMRWTDKGRSKNLEDRRGARASGGKGVKGKLGAGTIVIVLIAAVLGRTDLLETLGIGGGGGGGGGQASSQQTNAPAQSSPEDEKSMRFLSFLIDDMETVWTKRLSSGSTPYEAPVLVVFRNGVDSACGFASSATGPFYCPGDHKLYLDTAFFDDLAVRFKAAGDFAQAYVVAHEVGHHLQTLLGTSKRMRRAQAATPSRKNELSVLLELQADCYAGIWAHDAAKRNLLETGDLREALTAAMAIGDDTLQKQATGKVRPESWTHGSSAQRREWFQRGYDQGSVPSCNTFANEGI
tara:strand:+ start:36342 stop:37337 length:996 start_codon:yes stop_codon:yes gene_type:complete